MHLSYCILSRLGLDSEVIRILTQGVRQSVREVSVLAIGISDRRTVRGDVVKAGPFEQNLSRCDVELYECIRAFYVLQDCSHSSGTTLLTLEQSIDDPLLLWAAPVRTQISGDRLIYLKQAGLFVNDVEFMLV